MSYPQDLLFSKEHEWVRLEGTVATIGITDFAQNELGDVVFVETRACDEKVDLGEPLASLESTKHSLRHPKKSTTPLTGRVGFPE